MTLKAMRKDPTETAKDLLKALPVQKREEALRAMEETYCVHCGSLEEAAAEVKRNAPEHAVRFVEAVRAVPRSERSELFESVAEDYCTNCASSRNEDGECPEGCEEGIDLDDEFEDDGEDSGESDDDSEDEDDDGSEGEGEDA